MQRLKYYLLYPWHAWRIKSALRHPLILEHDEKAKDAFRRWTKRRANKYEFQRELAIYWDLMSRLADRYNLPLSRYTVKTPWQTVAWPK